MRITKRAAIAGAGLLVAAIVSCLPGSGPALLPAQDAGAPPNTVLGGDAAAVRADVDLGDPFAIVGMNPSHGPWTGGTRALMTGRGFTSKLRVFVGGVELPASDIVASDPTKAAILTPPGSPGPADVEIRDDATAKERTLPAGFFYDAFVLEPTTGATSGGTLVALTGSGTQWAAGTQVTIAGASCTGVQVTDATHLSCTTPKGSPGSADVDVITPDKTDTKARDAFTYSDSPDGYRGGLAGGALSGTLTVLAFDSWVGTPIAGAHAIAGGVIASALVKAADASGVATFSDPSLTGKVTVTVAAKCHQPITFVDVPVDHVTAYLDPVLDPTCGSGDPPSSGNGGVKNGGEIDGELVWMGGQEFQRATWSNVPPPQRKTERQVAYVFTASGSPADAFYLPPAASAITPASPGSTGYAYAIDAYPGSVTLYALAGIEDRSVTPPLFTAYVMGVAPGVPAYPSTRTTGANIPMTTLLDHGVTLTPNAPPPGPRGPDRFEADVAVTLGQSAYAILPIGSVVTLYPVGGSISLLGVPSLDGALAGQSYAISAAAVTGAGGGTPASYVSGLRTTDSNAPVAVGGFLSVPVLSQPANGTWSGTHVSFGSASSFDLAEVSVTSGSGLVSWTLVAPVGDTSFDVPDLTGFPDNVGLLRGPIQTAIYVARINSFSYGAVRYGQLGTGAWSAYAVDQLAGTY